MKRPRKHRLHSTNGANRPPAGEAPAGEPERVAPQADKESREPRWPWVLTAVTVLFNAVLLWPELIVDAPSRNDSALHLLMVHSAAEVIAQGGNPLDFWIPQLELGYPQFLYYQHLPHLLLALLHVVSGGAVSVDTLFHASQYLLLVMLPVTVAWSATRIGFPSMSAAIAGAASSLIAAQDRFGFEYGSYLWSGFGLYTQLWAMHLSFVVLACLVVTLREGRGHLQCAVAFAALALSHLLYAPMMALTGVLAVLSLGSPKTLPVRGYRLALVGGLALLFSAYLLVPFVQSSALWLSRMPWYDGAVDDVFEIVRAAARGELLDFNRLPVLSLLTVIGLAAAVRMRSHAARLLVVGLLFWGIVTLVAHPVAKLGGQIETLATFLGFRAIGIAELFGILAIGVGGAAILEQLQRRLPRGKMQRTWATVAIGVVVPLGLLTPAYIERAGAFRQNARDIATTTLALQQDTDASAVMALVASRPGGRVYAGSQKGWGDAMRVGPMLRVGDLLNAQRIPGYGHPYQGLALHTGLLFGIPDSSAALFDLFDIRTVITPAGATPSPVFERQATLGKYAVSTVKGSGVGSYVAVDSRRATDDQTTLYEAQVAWIRGRGPADRRVTRWDYGTPAGPPANRPMCPSGASTLSEAVESQRLSVVVGCASPATDTLAYMFKMTYHPQWRVWVDGVRVSPYMVSPGFLAVDVPPGEHRIDLAYVGHRSKLPLLLLGIAVGGLAWFFRRYLEAPLRAFGAM